MANMASGSPKSKSPRGCEGFLISAMARLTGLEPATPGVTGRYSNQLSYNRPLNPRVLGSALLLRATRAPVKRFWQPNFAENRQATRRA